MTNEPSQRPWRVETNRFGQHYVVCESGSGDRARDYIAGPIQNEADAALIVAAVNERERLAADEARYRMHNVVLRDIVRRMADMSESLLANYEYHYREDVNSMAFVQNSRDFIREARAAIEEGRRLSTKPFGRPATEQEVDSRFPGIEWCIHCTTDCPLSHHDALSVCDHYTGPDKKGSNK